MSCHSEKKKDFKSRQENNFVRKYEKGGADNT